MNMQSHRADRTAHPLSFLPKDVASFERYSRQMLFAGIGESGQQRLASSSAVIVGCGAIGASTAALLARAGVGRLRILDRDFVEPSNLQRQALFDESDARESLPKAVAAQQKLRAINSAISIEGIVADLTPQNAHELLSGFDLLLDGTDNFEARFLLNDYAVKHNRPWIYAAAVGSYGVTLTIRPGRTACLACLLEVADAPAGVEETCDTIGVLAPIVQLVSSLESAEALKLLAGKEDALKFLEILTAGVAPGANFPTSTARHSPTSPCAAAIPSKSTSALVRLIFRLLARALPRPSNPSATTNSFFVSASRPMR